MAERHVPGVSHLQPPGDAAEARHEESDVNIGAVFGFALGLIVAGVVISVLVWGLFGYFQGREARRVAPEFPLAVQQENRLPPEPRLQTNPREDLIDFRQDEDRILNSYGWVDQPAGVVRIPIDRAMKTTVQRGLPARASTP